MFALKVPRETSTPPAKARRYGIRLRISPADREDAWELCRVTAHYGGVEVEDCFFAFPNEERWLSALEALRFRFGPEYFEPVQSSRSYPDSGEADTSGYRHLELLVGRSVSVVRLRNPKYFPDDEIAGLTREWNSVADCPECRTLVVDCSSVQILNSAMLSSLIVLQRRLKQKGGTLVLCGLRSEVRRTLRWTKLDRFFEIKEDAHEEAAVLA